MDLPPAPGESKPYSGASPVVPAWDAGQPFIIRPRTNRLAVASLVCALFGLYLWALLSLRLFTTYAAPEGIVSSLLYLGSSGCMAPFGGIPAVITGHIALAQMQRTGWTMRGEALAVAGVILGYIEIACFLLLPLYLFWDSANRCVWSGCH